MWYSFLLLFKLTHIYILLSLKAALVPSQMLWLLARLLNMGWLQKWAALELGLQGVGLPLGQIKW